MKSVTLADLCDQHGTGILVSNSQLKSFGALTSFHGCVRTLRVFEDNSLIRSELEKTGEGNVLVVDGGGSMHCALFGDMLAKIATAQKWSGVVINGCIRDSKVLLEIPIGVFALGTNPRRSLKQNSGEKDVELSFSGIKIFPGNWLYADEDGFGISEKELF